MKHLHDMVATEQSGKNWKSEVIQFGRVYVLSQHVCNYVIDHRLCMCEVVYYFMYLSACSANSLADDFAS